MQRLTDFVDGRTPKPGPAPASSYRLGVREASLHDDLLPESLADALRAAATGAFERSMPGFVGEDAILHGVETHARSCRAESKAPGRQIGETPRASGRIQALGGSGRSRHVGFN